MTLDCDEYENVYANKYFVWFKAVGANSYGF